MHVLDRPSLLASHASGVRSAARRYALAAAILTGATAVAWGWRSLSLADAHQVATYLLAVALIAASCGRGPAVLGSFAAVGLFNFFFTAPRYTLHVHDSQYLVTFGVLLAVALLVSTLTARLREQREAARLRERQTDALYRISRELSAAPGTASVVRVAEQLVRELLALEPTAVIEGEHPAAPLNALARRAREERRPLESRHEQGGVALALPLLTRDAALGALVVRPPAAGAPGPSPEERRLLEAIADQLALALQRERLTEGIHRAQAQAETERLRSALLSSVSHDIRTPLASIAGASSSLLEARGALPEAVARELLTTIYDEADRLGRLVEDLLQMTRLATGGIEPSREWHLVEDLVGSALTRIARLLREHEVRTDIPPDLPLVAVDGVLVEQLLINLLENAARYTPPGSEIEVSARAGAEGVSLVVADRGPGLDAGSRERLFEPFFRGAGAGSRGVGLGLAICRAIAELHGGSIAVEPRPGGGARFCVRFPPQEQPPELQAVDDDAPLARGALSS